MSIEYEEEVITSKLALEYLQTFVGNRDIRQPWVDYLASQILAGLWRTTHQGIAFDKNGRLVDGHHRLWACVVADKPIRVNVARGLQEADVFVLDTGGSRNTADIAHYDGVAADKMAWPVAKMLVRGPTMANTPVPYKVVSGWYNFYKEGIDAAILYRGACRPMRKRMTVAMTTVIARASFALKQPDVLRRMVEIIHSGQRQFEADSAAVAFRDAWISGRLGSTTDAYFKLESAIRAFVERRPIVKMYAAEAELFSVPKLPQSLAYQSVQSIRNKAAGRNARRQLQPAA